MPAASASPDLNRPEIRQILDLLLAGIQQILEEKLAGLYISGSLASGEFELDISDIDLVAALRFPLEPEESVQLEAMHAAIGAQHPRWMDRIEVAYLPISFLMGSSSPFELAVISPGEPFHCFSARAEDWIINRHKLYEDGIALLGPPPREWMKAVSDAELKECIRLHLQEWPQWVMHLPHRGGQSYSILTMCRALFTFEKGGNPSKKEAAEWAQQALPAWKPLIQQALAWRASPDHGALEAPETFMETQDFVNFVVAQVRKERS